MLSDPEIIIRDDAHDLAVAAADILTTTAKDCGHIKGRFLLALSGGSTPRILYKILSHEPYLSEVPWPKTHIFWVDERWVPLSDPASNYGATKKDLLDQVPIPPSQTHPMTGPGPPQEGARTYERDLMHFFGLGRGQFPVFDLIFLGIGADGHTASLFPGHGALDEKKRLAVAVKGGNPFVHRVTLTLPVLNHASRLIFMVSGKDKATVLETVFGKREADLPAQKIQAIHGKLTWLLDREAASMLSRE